MVGSLALVKFVAKAAMNVAGFGLAGDLVGEALPEMAKQIYDRWARGRPPAEVRAEAQAVAALAPEEAHDIALQLVGELASDQPQSIQLSLISYLAQVPAAARQSQRRPADPTGRTVAANLTFARPADVLALLPARPA